MSDTSSCTILFSKSFFIFWVVIFVCIYLTQCAESTDFLIRLTQNSLSFFLYFSYAMMVLIPFFVLLETGDEEAFLSFVASHEAYRNLAFQCGSLLRAALDGSTLLDKEGY